MYVSDVRVFNKRFTYGGVKIMRAVHGARTARSSVVMHLILFMYMYV